MYPNLMSLAIMNAIARVKNEMNDDQLPSLPIRVLLRETRFTIIATPNNGLIAVRTEMPAKKVNSLG